MSIKALDRAFGRHVRSLRKARGLTQEQLAELSNLSADTIGRLEHGGFSPSLDTLRKLCAGFDLRLSTLFESFELNYHDPCRELIDLLSTRRPAEIKLITAIVRTVLDGLDGLGGEQR